MTYHFNILSFHGLLVFLVAFFLFLIPAAGFISANTPKMTIFYDCHFFHSFVDWALVSATGVAVSTADLRFLIVLSIIHGDRSDILLRFKGCTLLPATSIEN